MIEKKKKKKREKRRSSKDQGDAEINLKNEQLYLILKK